MRTEAEIGVLQPHATGCLGPPEAREARRDFPQSLWRAHGPADTLSLDFGL